MIREKKGEVIREDKGVRVKRSAGVTVLAILFVAIGAWGCIGAARSLANGDNRESVSAAFWEAVRVCPGETRALLEGNPMVEDLLMAIDEIVGSEGVAASNRISVVMCGITIILGIGIWLLKEWARKAAIIFFVAAVPVVTWAGHLTFSAAFEMIRRYRLTMFYFAFGKVTMYSFLMWLNLFALAANAAVIAYYLTRPGVKAQFEKGQ